MSEIPKDGKTYLAWHKVYGIKMMCSRFGSTYYDMSCLEDEPEWYSLDEFTRWMDEKGQWHEVE